MNYPCVVSYRNIKIAACRSGTWGTDCLLDCKCRDYETKCDVRTGCAACPDGFTGGDCGKDIDECTHDNSCDDHSTCRNSIGTYKCVCHMGYTQNTTKTCRGKLLFVYRPCNFPARKEVEGTWGQEVHFLHVKRYDFVLFLVVIIGLSPNCVYNYIVQRIITSRSSVTLCR